MKPQDDPATRASARLTDTLAAAFSAATLFGMLAYAGYALVLA